ncbi:Cof-type HAD-IIB family hydrolase [Neobacillus cucumis]|uniref:Cof-type HAD-IIB family hydrolase n=1 Tax=Neobacillus cucumis TaxID=1740721 RepID=UPI0019642376|nr:Cof-type HAD-IIB family hydrolase [Neobacillus cucumis]MBM7651019.1 Cof subfamily protein (haloacid dehalogenase superfamily) [Neobacillus cucumis]
MNYKVVILDIDGTIVPHGKTVSHATKNAIQMLKDKNLEVVIATGRAPYFSTTVIEETGVDSMIFFNGSYVYHEGKEIYQNAIDKSILKTIHQLSGDYQHPLTFLSGTSFKATDLSHPFVVEAYSHDPWKPELAQPRYWMEQDIYQLFLHCNLEEEIHYKSKIPELDFRRWSSGAKTCDVNLTKSNKAVGITKLLERLGIAPDEAVAFGDGLNDIEMLSLVGMGVAMGAASDELKQAANMVTLSAEEDGVVYGLKQLGLI